LKNIYSFLSTFTEWWTLDDENALTYKDEISRLKAVGCEFIALSLQV